jgi:predicted nucleic acid-binding protein
MPFAIDASVVAAWALEENHAVADAAARRLQSDSAIVPGLWWYELRNVLVIAERRGRLTEHRTTEFLSRIAQLPIVLEQSPDEAAVLALARRHRLTIYDAAYLELAIRKALPLATLDTALMRAARDEFLPLIGEGGG